MKYAHSTILFSKWILSYLTKPFIYDKQEINKNQHHVYDDKTIENMKQYFKVEHDSDALLKYIRGNRINHDVLAWLRS